MRQFSGSGSSNNMTLSMNNTNLTASGTSPSFGTMLQAVPVGFIEHNNKNNQDRKLPREQDRGRDRTYSTTNRGPGHCPYGGG